MGGPDALLGMVGSSVLLLGLLLLLLFARYISLHPLKKLLPHGFSLLDAFSMELGMKVIGHVPDLNNTHSLYLILHHLNQL